MVLSLQNATIKTIYNCDFINVINFIYGVTNTFILILYGEITRYRDFKGKNPPPCQDYLIKETVCANFRDLTTFSADPIQFILVTRVTQINKLPILNEREINTQN